MARKDISPEKKPKPLTKKEKKNVKEREKENMFMNDCFSTSFYWGPFFS